MSFRQATAGPSPATPRAERSLARLAHHRWSIPLLADLSSHGGARISELAHRLGGSRPAVRQAAEALADMGLLAPLGGHGHPLRPEVLLTERGRRTAEAARRLEATVSDVPDVPEGAGAPAVPVELVRRKWTLPVLHALGTGPRRYGEVRRALPSVTDRALSGALRALEAAGLLTREVVEDAPPSTRYRTTARARGVVRETRALAGSLGTGPGASPPRG